MSATEVKITCPSCTKSYKVKIQGGKPNLVIKCPNCQTEIPVQSGTAPAVATAPAPPPPPPPPPTNDSLDLDKLFDLDSPDFGSSEPLPTAASQTSGAPSPPTQPPPASPTSGPVMPPIENEKTDVDAVSFGSLFEGAKEEDLIDSSLTPFFKTAPPGGTPESSPSTDEAHLALDRLFEETLVEPPSSFSAPSAPEVEARPPDPVPPPIEPPSRPVVETSGFGEDITAEREPSAPDAEALPHEFVSKFEPPPPQPAKRGAYKKYGLYAAAGTAAIAILGGAAVFFIARWDGSEYQPPSADTLEKIREIRRRSFDQLKLGSYDSAIAAMNLLASAHELDSRNLGTASSALCTAAIRREIRPMPEPNARLESGAITLLAQAGTTTPDAQLADTCRKYSLGDHRAVITTIEQTLFASMKEEPLVLTLYGLALLRAGEAEKAREVLDAVGRDDTSNRIAIRALSESYLALKSASNARRFAEYLIAQDDNDIQAHLLKARANFLDGKAAEEVLKDIQALLNRPLAPDLQAQLYTTLSDGFAQAQDSSRAIEYLNKAAESAPKDADLQLRVGLEWLDNPKVADAQRAIEYLKRSMAGRPEHIPTLSALARAHATVGDLQAAFNTINPMIEKFPSQPELLMALAEIQIKLGQPRDAETSLKKIMDDPTVPVRAYVLMGQALAAARVTGDADAWLKRAIEKEPSAATLTARADFLRMTKQYQASLELYEKVLVESPDYTAALLGLAETQARLDNIPAASALIDRIKALAPRSIPALALDLQVKLATEDPSAAEAILSQMKQIAPQDPRTQFSEIEFHLIRGNTSEAHALLKLVPESAQMQSEYPYLKARLVLTAMQRNEELPSDLTIESGVEAIQVALDRQPREERYLWIQGNLLLLSDQVNDAVVAAEALVAVNPHFKEAYLLYGDILAETNRFSKALEQYKQAEPLFEAKVPVWTRLGTLYEKMEKLNEAAAYFERARKADPKNPSHLVALGLIYNKKNEFSKAGALFLEAVKKDPKRAEPYYYLGFIYKGFKQFKESIRAFEDYLALAPTSQDSKEVQEEIYYMKRHLGQKVN